MQREALIPLSQVELVLSSAFADTPLVYETYSKFDRSVRCFSNLDILKTHVQTERAEGAKYFDLTVHYPETRGHVHTKAINLQPEKCGGATWREKVEGWGLIQLQLTYQEDGVVKCRVAVNTEKRANAWAETVPELGAPSLWNWRLVEKHARRLIRVLRNGG